MIHRQTHPNGVVTYQSALLSQLRIQHAFTTRIGGVSQPPFDSLNFQPAASSVAHLGPGPILKIRDAQDSPTVKPADGNDARSTALLSSAPPAEEYATAVENFGRLRDAIGCNDRRVICIWQVHGRAVCVWPDHANDATPRNITTVVAQADALATADPSVLICVRVADCVPVLLADRHGRAVAAVHAGWRGVVDGVTPAAIETLRQRFGVAASDVVAAIGPCIGTPHFEVGEEVAEAFVKARLSDAIDRTTGRKPRIDLAGALAIQLERIGLAATAIDRTDRCTFRDHDEFFSHRRDAGRTGRMAAVIGVRAAE